MIGAFLARVMIRVPTTLENVLSILPDEHAANLQPFQYSRVSDQLELAMLPSFGDVPATQRQELFLGKVEQCNVIYDFECASDLSSKCIRPGRSMNYKTMSGATGS